MLLSGDVYGVVPQCAGGVCSCALLMYRFDFAALSASVLSR